MPPGPRRGLPFNDFEQEDAETHYKDDELQNDALHEVDEGEEVQKSAVNQRLGAMSVHKGHRIFDHMGAMVCVKSGDYSMWVNRKMRPDCSGNPSTLGMEVLKRMAKR